LKIFKEDGAVDLVIEKALAYLNLYVAPHNLVSISIFEEDHPSKKQFFNIAVLHKGDGITPFKRPVEIIGDIYQYKNVECY